MTPEKCPGCGAKLRPEMLACPNCPMSFPEDEGPTGAVNPLKQSRYYQFVFPVIFFGAIGAIVWYLGTGLMRLGEANSEIETANFLGGKGTGSPATPPGGGSVGSAFKAAVGAGGSASGEAVTSETTDAKEPDDAGSVAIMHVDDEASARPPEPRRAAAVAEWKLRGTIYDLTTLKPLPGCAITFADEETNASVKTRTDSAGRYRAIVPPLEGRGYAVAIAKSGYAPNYLDPGAEGVREKDAAERKSIARDLSSTLGAAPSTIQSVSAKPLITDFYLAPRP